MKRRLFLSIALLTLAMAGPALADRERLTGAEIESLLAGNTIVGTWHGNAYRQFFDANGSTVYVPANGAAENGRWRVDTTLDAYQSWWERTGWTNYYVERDGARLFWYDSRDGQPFEILPGKQVSW